MTQHSLLYTYCSTVPSCWHHRVGRIFHLEVYIYYRSVFRLLSGVLVENVSPVHTLPLKCFSTSTLFVDMMLQHKSNGYFLCFQDQIHLQLQLSTETTSCGSWLICTWSNLFLITVLTGEAWNWLIVLMMCCDQPSSQFRRSQQVKTSQRALLVSREVETTY